VSKLVSDFDALARLPERAFFTFVPLREAQVRSTRGFMACPEHVVHSGREVGRFHRHTDPPPPAGPRYSPNRVSIHDDPPISETNTYNASDDRDRSPRGGGALIGKLTVYKALVGQRRSAAQ
jgi:hypothetical protein